MKDFPVLRQMKKICLALPDTKLTWPWDSAHFRVGEKIFAGCGPDAIGFKLPKRQARMLIDGDPRFTKAKYVGKHGWVTMDVSKQKDWDEVRRLIYVSYRLIAPAKSLEKFEGKVIRLREVR